MKHIEVALPSFPSDIDPVKVWSYYHFMLVQSLYSTLVRIDEKGHLVSHLANKWKVSEDGKTIHFYIDKNAKFSNNKKITAKDVAISLARHCWPKSPSIIKGYLTDKIKGIEHLSDGEIPTGLEIINDQELLVHLTKPYTPFLHLLAMPGFSISQSDNPHTGSGPMIGQFDKSKNLWKLKESETFFGKKTKLKSMNVRSLSGKEAIEKSFKNEEIDIILGVPIGEINNFNLPKDVLVRETDTLSFNHLFYNVDRELFKDKDFRKDFGLMVQSLAWKKEYLSQFLEKQETLLPKGVMAKNYYEIKPQKITLDEFIKKWKISFQGKLLKIVVMPGHFNQFFLNELESSLESIGFNLQLIRATSAEFVKAIKEKDYDILSGPYIGNFPDPDGFLEPLNEKSGMKFGTYNTVPLLKKLEEVRFSKDASYRMKSYTDILRKYEEEWSFIPLYRMNFPIIHNKKLSVPDSSYRYEAELWNIFWN